MGAGHGLVRSGFCAGAPSSPSQASLKICCHGRFPGAREGTSDTTDTNNVPTKRVGQQLTTRRRTRRLRHSAHRSGCKSRASCGHCGGGVSLAEGSAPRERRVCRGCFSHAAHRPARVAPCHCHCGCERAVKLDACGSARHDPRTTAHRRRHYCPRMCCRDRFLIPQLALWGRRRRCCCRRRRRRRRRHARHPHHRCAIQWRPVRRQPHARALETWPPRVVGPSPREGAHTAARTPRGGHQCLYRPQQPQPHPRAQRGRLYAVRNLRERLVRRGVSSA